MKARILHQLRQTEAILSGEKLSRVLGISRVSVWKHVRALQNCGYEIKSSAKGYRLIDSPDTPYSWEMGARHAQTHYHERVSSTMTLARDLARQGAPHMSVVVAGHQTGGRGRLNRKWRSAKGGLYFTLIVRPEIEPVYAGRLGFYAAVIWAETLRRRYGVPAAVKWPNDILVEGKKLVGLLAEMEADSDRVVHLALGCGINVNNRPQDKEPGATSLARILGRPVSCKNVLTAFLDRFEAEFEIAGTQAVIDRWKTLTITLNRRVKVVTIREQVHGLAVDVDGNGALLLKLDDGSIKPVVYGDCFIQ